MALEHTAVAVLFWLDAKLYGPGGGGVSTLRLGVRSTGHRAKSLGQGLGDVQRPSHFTTRTCLAGRRDVGVGADAQARVAHCPRSTPRFLRLQQASTPEGRKGDPKKVRNAIKSPDSIASLPLASGIVREARLVWAEASTDKTKRQEGKDGQGPWQFFHFMSQKITPRQKKKAAPRDGLPNLMRKLSGRVTQ